VSDSWKSLESEGVRGASRREFLKGAAGVTAGLALSGVLGGCSKDTEASGSASGKPSYAVYESDILYIGGGIGSLTGTYEAIKNGRHVTIVDKGPYRASGATGMNWDCVYIWLAPAADGSKDPNDYKMDPTYAGVVNDKVQRNATASDPNYDYYQFWAAMGGECLPYRTPDGSQATMFKVPFWSTMGGFPRHTQDSLSSSPLVTVNDRTMITDLLINDGRCVGASGVHLPTGEFRIYRANAVILAAGGNGWLNGWDTVSAHSINSPDNTSDVEMAAYRHGARIGDSEYAAYDLITIAPTGTAYGFNVGLGADANVNELILDGNKKAFLRELLTEDDMVRLTYDRPYFNQILGKYLTEDPTRATPNGGLYVDLSSEEARAKLRLAYARSIPLYREQFGIDFTQPGTLVEVGLEMYEHGGTPVIDENLMTEIPGLFASRGAGVFGSRGGTEIMSNERMGSYAVRSALKYLETAGVPAAIDFTPAEEEFARLTELHSRTVASGGLRPHVVRQNIQKACGTCMSVIRETAKLESASAELARIRAEDLPKQVLEDSSRTFNTEWRMAIENYNMIEIAEMSVNATLMREESRGHFRPDFPEPDDANWRCMIGAKLQDGAMAFEKITLPTA